MVISPQIFLDLHLRLEHEHTGLENSLQNLLVGLEGSFDLGTVITRGPEGRGVQNKDILSRKQREGHAQGTRYHGYFRGPGA